MADTRTAAQGARPRPDVAYGSFGEAFRNARAAGEKTFEWRGKTYTTKTAEEQSREIAARAAPGSGRGPSAGRTAADRDVTVGRAEIPTGPSKAPASTGEGGMSDTARNVLNTLGALGAGTGVGLGARALVRREAAKRAAEAERLASRIEPRMRRSGEGIDEAMKQARVEMAREPRLEPARAMSAAEKKAPAVQGDKARMTPRSRTRDEEDVEFRKGGKVKTYASGGSVKGAGIAQRGVRKCKVY